MKWPLTRSHQFHSVATVPRKNPISTLPAAMEQPQLRKTPAHTWVGPGGVYRAASDRRCCFAARETSLVSGATVLRSMDAMTSVARRDWSTTVSLWLPVNQPRLRWEIIKARQRKTICSLSLFCWLASRFAAVKNYNYENRLSRNFQFCGKEQYENCWLLLYSKLYDCKSRLICSNLSFAVGWMIAVFFLFFVSARISKSPVQQIVKPISKKFSLLTCLH